MDKYQVQSYNDTDNDYTYDQKQIQRAEDQEVIIGYLKQAYNIIVPVISIILAVIKIALGIRLWHLIMTRTRWQVRRDFHIKLGPMLNPKHLALLEFASAAVFLLIPIWMLILKKKLTRKVVVIVIAFCAVLCVVMLPFTSMFGSFWLFGINLFLYCCFLFLDYMLYDHFKVSEMLNKSYSV